MRMKIWLGLVSIVSVVACGPQPPAGGERQEPAAPASPSPTLALVPPADIGPGPAPEDVPADAPNPQTDPAAFYEWRVEQMFLTRDQNKDGVISRDEFTGKPEGFDAIDADHDEKLTKPEVSDHVFATFVMRAQRGESSTAPAPDKHED